MFFWIKVCGFDKCNIRLATSLNLYGVVLASLLPNFVELLIIALNYDGVFAVIMNHCWHLTFFA